MRAKDLRKYKTLDITELSGSPWNDAEKVLGLDQDDKVIMAEPEETVTPEYIDEAIDQAMEVETARTEDTYAKKSEVPDLDDYYTKEEVDEAISGITVDLSDYYTKDETDQAISAATQDLASTDYVDDAIAAIPEPDLSDYYTKGETDGAISTALVPYATKGWVSSQSYANQNYVAFKVNEAMQIETARTESTYAKPSDIPSLDGYATEEYVDNAVSSATQDMATEQYVNDAIAAIPGVDLSDYALISSVTADINTAIANETARTESTYAKPSQIPSLDGYATEDWVEEQGYLTEHQDLSAYAKTTAVTEDIQTAMATETGRTEEVYAKKSEIPSLDGYATQAWTTGDTESRITTAMAAETARTESTYLKEHQSLDNYYTKSQVDAEITGATEGLASEQYVDDAIAAIPPVDLSPYAKTTAVTQDIQTAIAAETARTESTYLKEHQSLADYSTTSEVEGMIASAKSEVEAEIPANVSDLANDAGYITTGNTTFDQFFNDVQYDSNTKRINFYNRNDSIVGYVDATNFIKDGMVDNVYITGSTLVISFNTDAGQEDIEIALTDIFDPANYYDKTDVDGMFAAETARTDGAYVKVSVMPTFIGNIQVNGEGDATGMRRTSVKFVRYNSSTGEWAGYSNSLLYFSLINGQNIANNNTSGIDNIILPTFNDVATAITEAIENETGRTESTYAKKTEIPSLSEYATEQYVDDAIAAIPAPDMSGYVSKDELTGGTSTETVVIGELDNNVKIYCSEDNNMWYYLPLSTTNIDNLYVLNLSNFQGFYSRRDFFEPPILVNGQGYSFDGNESVQVPSTGGVYNIVVGSSGGGEFIYTPQNPSYLVLDISNLTISFTTELPSFPVSNPGILDNYWTTSETQSAITAATQGMVTSGDVATQIGTAMAAETARTESTYLKEHQSLDNYYTKSEVDAEFVSAATSVGNAIDAAVDGLASEDYVNNAVSGLASEDYVDNAITAATEGLASEQYVDDAIAGIVIPELPSDYATTGDVADAVAGLASETYVDDAISTATEHMVTTDDLQDYATEQYVDDAVNGLAQSIGMLGMVNDVTESNGTVTVQKTGMQDGQIVTGSTSFSIATPGDIQTAMAAETARTESTYLKEHQSLDNYYTKSEVDAEITGATEDMATKTWVGQQGYLTQHQDLSAYAKTTAVTEDIASAMAAETARTESTYAKPSQIPSLAGYASETYVDNAIASETARTESTYLKEHQDISGKLDKTDFNTYTGATETVLAGKLDTTAYTQGMAAETARTESTYAKPSQIPSLTGYATEQWVEEQGYLTQHQSLAEYYTKTEIDGMIGDIESLLASI